MAQITASLELGTRVHLSNGTHEWFSDEPPDLGGTDSAPTPYELLLGGLAACTAITVRLYARHKGIDVPWMRLEYEHGRYDGEAADGGELERITARVTIGGTFDEPVRRRLAQIVTRCPVHRTLTSGVAIVDEVAFADAVPPSL